MLWSCCVWWGKGCPGAAVCAVLGICSPHTDTSQMALPSALIHQYQLSSDWWYQSWPWRQMCFTHFSVSWRGNQAGYWKLNKQLFKSFFFFFFFFPPPLSPFPPRGWEGDVFLFLESQECFCHLMRQMTAQKFVSLPCQSTLVVFIINK